MIKSMTGYGSAKGVVDGLEISVELKSVNNRYLDASVRLPRSFLFAEEMIKTRVQSHISRGKEDVFVNVDSSQAGDMTVKHCRGVSAAEGPDCSQRQPFSRRADRGEEGS